MTESERDRRTTVGDWLRAGGVQAVILTLAIVFHRPLFRANFAAVEPGRAYRSAQLQESLEEVLHQNRIATVLNLRGGSQRDAWYRHEVETAAKTGADFYDYPLWPDRRPSRNQLLALVDLFERCRYPILIHCKSGADRTGMASGIYMMTREGIAPEIAVKAFAITHSHVALGGPEHLHEPFHEYAAYLKTKRLSHTAGRFRQWLREEYRGTDDDREFQPMQPGARLAHRMAEAKTRH